MRWLLMGVVVAVAFVVYSLFHCILTPSARVRSLPKGVWILAIIILPVIGAALWYWLGMPRDTRPAAAAQRGMGPDDDAEFLRQLNIRRRQQQRAEELSERERQLRQREADLEREYGEGKSAGSSKKDQGRSDARGDDSATGQDDAGA